MSGDAKVLDQNPVSAPVSSSTVHAQVGSLNKEAPVSAVGLSEIRPAGPEIKHNIGQESADLGVGETRDEPDLTQIADVQHAGPHIPVSTTPTKTIQYPMSEEEIGSKLKTGQDDDSGKSLAKLIQKIIKKMMGGF